MNTDILKGSWHQIKGEAKAQWGKLTKDDLDQIEGRAEQLVGKVQERYGWDRQHAQQEVDGFISRHTAGA